MTEATATPKQRAKLPQIQRVFATAAELDAGQTTAVTAGHAQTVRRYEVIGGGKSVFVLAQTEKHAAGEAATHLGLTVKSLEPSSGTRGPKASWNPSAVAAQIVADPKGMSKADMEAIIKALQERVAAA